MRRILLFSLFIFVVIGIIIFWRLHNRKYGVTFGISFSKNHAEWLGGDWKKTYSAILTDLKPRFIRISAPWDEVEAVQCVFDFSAVDWQMDQAKKYGAKVTLVVGQKAPRWPECHVPAWIDDYSDEKIKEFLLQYVRTAVQRYKDHPAMEWWQVENEPFIKFRFGDCARYKKDFIFDEIALVRTLDSSHQILVTDSGELGMWYSASRAGDTFGTTLYRVVRNKDGKIVDYNWLPPWVYTLKSYVLGKGLSRFVIAELQAEPWFTDKTPAETLVVEQEETFNPERFSRTLDYAERTGATRAYLWGVEWWYWMKEKHGDVRYWEMAKEAMGRGVGG